MEIVLMSGVFDCCRGKTFQHYVILFLNWETSKHNAIANKSGSFHGLTSLKIWKWQLKCVLQPCFYLILIWLWSFVCMHVWVWVWMNFLKAFFFCWDFLFVCLLMIVPLKIDLSLTPIPRMRRPLAAFRLFQVFCLFVCLNK